MVQDLCIGHLPRDAPSCKKRRWVGDVKGGFTTLDGLSPPGFHEILVERGVEFWNRTKKKHDFSTFAGRGKHPKMCNPTILFQFSTILPKDITKYHRRPGRYTSIDITYVTCKYRMWCEGGTTVHRPFHLLKAGLSFMNLNSCLLNTWSPNTWPLDLYGPSNKPLYHV